MEAKVSFIVLSHNDGKMAINAIKSVKKLKTKYKYDIFVVDNGSKDGTPGLIKKKFRDVKIVELPKNIGTVAYDKAIKKSKSKYIFFTGCDVEVKSDMLDKLVSFMEKNKNAMLAAPKYIDFYSRKKIDSGGTWLSRSFYSGTFKDDTLGNNFVEIPYIGTGLIRREIIRKFGFLFDHDYFFYGEDVDLGLRIRLLDFKVFYIPDSVVYHRGSVSRKIHKSYRLTFLMERNLMMTFLKILYLKNIILLAPYVLFMRFVAILRDMLTLEFMDALARLRAIFWVIFHFSLIYKKREKLQKSRKVSDNVLFNLFSEKYLLKRIIDF